MKKLLSLVLAIALLMGACAFTASAEEDRPTLRMLQRLNAAYVIDGNPVIDAWEDILGFNLDIEAPPISSYSDRRNVIMASGDLPDIIYVGDTGTNYVKWATDGLLLDLTEYFNEETLPHPYKVLTEDELYSVRIPSLDNHIYSLPRVQTKPWDCIIYRADWLEKLGLEVPKTPEEFKEVMIAFATQDPDGNGVDDTYGWCYNTAMGAEHRSMLSGFGVRPSDVPDENGNYVLMQAQDAYMDYLDWIKEMYDAGAVDPEFYLVTMYQDDDLWDAGKMGARYCNSVIEHLISYGPSREAFRAANPDATLVAGPALMKEGETVANVYYNPQIWGNYAISADTKYLEEALRFLDLGYTDEVNELLMFGVQGVTYETFDPVRRYAAKTEEQKLNSDKYVASYATINYQREDKGLLIANGNTEEEVQQFITAYDEIGAQENRVFYLGGGSLVGVNEVKVAIADAGIDDKFNELRTGYICGNVERDELVDFINNEMVPAYQPILDIYAENDLNK